MIGYESPVLCDGCGSWRVVARYTSRGRTTVTVCASDELRSAKALREYETREVLLMPADGGS